MDTYSDLIEVICKNTNIDTAYLSLLIKGNFKRRHYKKGAYFARQGELSDKIGFNIDGILSMQVIRDDGSEYIKSFIKPNDFVLATFDESKPNPYQFRL
jgi:CRP-like cAMP-binding protein